MGDFLIENGVLIKYQGPSGDAAIPDSVTGIGDYAFRGCSNPAQLVLPDSVKRIGQEAFVRCTGLTTIRFPDVSRRSKNGPLMAVPA